MLWLFEFIFRNKLYFCIVTSYLCRREEVTELKTDAFFTRNEPNLAWIKDKLLLGVTHFFGSDRHKTGSALALRETKLTWRSESPFLVGRIIHKRQGKLCFNLRNVQILVTLYTMIYILPNLKSLNRLFKSSRMASYPLIYNSCCSSSSHIIKRRKLTTIILM